MTCLTMANFKKHFWGHKRRNHSTGVKGAGNNDLGLYGSIPYLSATKERRFMESSWSEPISMLTCSELTLSTNWESPTTPKLYKCSALPKSRIFSRPLERSPFPHLPRQLQRSSTPEPLFLSALPKSLRYLPTGTSIEAHLWWPLTKIKSAG